MAEVRLLKNIESKTYKDFVEDLFISKNKQVRWRGKLLGFYIKSKHGLIFVAPRYRKKHYFRIFEGYGFNKQFLLHLAQIGVWQIWIKEQDTGRILKAKPITWLKKGIEFHSAKTEDEQLVLRERDFDKIYP